MIQKLRKSLSWDDSSNWVADSAIYLNEESKMQDLAIILDDKGYSKSAETIDRFRFDIWNYRAFPRPYWS